MQEWGLFEGNKGIKDFFSFSRSTLKCGTIVEDSFGPGSAYAEVFQAFEYVHAQTLVQANTISSRSRWVLLPRRLTYVLQAAPSAAAFAFASVSNNWGTRGKGKFDPTSGKVGAGGKKRRRRREN